jgi:hypothetical protein
MDVWGDSRGKTPGGPLCSSSCILFGDTRREVTGLEFFRGEYLFMLSARITESLQAASEKIGKAIKLAPGQAPADLLEGVILHQLSMDD